MKRSFLENWDAVSKGFLEEEVLELDFQDRIKIQQRVRVENYRYSKKYE